MKLKLKSVTGELKSVIGFNSWDQPSQRGKVSEQPHVGGQLELSGLTDSVATA